MRKFYKIFLQWLSSSNRRQMFESYAAVKRKQSSDTSVGDLISRLIRTLETKKTKKVSCQLSMSNFWKLLSTCPNVGPLSMKWVVLPIIINAFQRLLTSLVTVWFVKVIVIIRFLFERQMCCAFHLNLQKITSRGCPTKNRILHRWLSVPTYVFVLILSLPCSPMQLRLPT